MEYKDYYKTLGVTKKASADEIQRAYRKLARKFHPDVNKSEAAEARFKEINEAHQVLSDPDKRSKYDRFGSAWQQAQRSGGGPPPGFEDVFSRFGRTQSGGFDFGGEGFSSFFEALFGGGRGGGATWSTAGSPGGFDDVFGGTGFQGPRAGANQEARLRVTLEEAARGGSREIGLADPAGGQRNLRVKIPAGVRPGQRIRLAGQGASGSGGGPRGDLLLTIEIVPHPRFRLEGSDLHTTLLVTPWEAALGAEAAVQTLDGEVKVRVPAGTSSGRRIRLRERGFPAKERRGDLYAEVRIAIPKKIGERERELYEELAKLSTFAPRDR